TRPPVGRRGRLPKGHWKPCSGRPTMRTVTNEPADVAPAEEPPPSSCRGCGSTRVRFWRFARASDARLARRSSFRLEHCLDCGTAALADDSDGGDSRSLYESGTYARPAPA